MPISKDLLLAILSMDSYNRGYGAGINDSGATDDPDGLGESGNIGNARVLARSDDIDYDAWQAAGFYAVAYETDYGTVISYRGTNADSLGNLFTDAINGYGTALGTSDNDQSHLAAEFYQAVTGTTNDDPRNANVTLAGHSLGGGLAGLVGALYHQEALIFDNMPFQAANDAGDDKVIIRRRAA